MSNPDHGKTFENDYWRFSKFKRDLSEIVRDQVEITLEYTGKINHLMGRKLNYDELGEIAQRSLSLIFTGLTPEEKAKEAAIPVLRSWGINPGANDRIQVNGKNVNLTRREYELLEIFATSTGHVVTHELVEKRFRWTSHGDAFSSFVGRINDKLETLGSDAPLKLVSIRTVGYRANPKTEISTTFSSSSASDRQRYPQPQTPNP